MMADWPALALYWYGTAGRLPEAAQQIIDPIFGRPLPFYLFTLPAWQLVSGWLMTLSVIVGVVAVFFMAITGGTRLLGRRPDAGSGTWRGVSIAFAFVLLMLAVRTYLGRFDYLFEDHTIFAGVSYTYAHVTLTGMLIVAFALLLGAAIALINAVAAPRVAWLVAAAAPAALCYLANRLIGWDVGSFQVKTNELVRETPYIAHNIEMTRRAFGLDRIAQHPFPAETSVEAAEPASNQATLQNIRLWDWRALQDTLRQIQEIRTYYDFPHIDIDRSMVDGQVRP